MVWGTLLFLLWTSFSCIRSSCKRVQLHLLIDCHRDVVGRGLRASRTWSWASKNHREKRQISLKMANPRAEIYAIRFPPISHCFCSEASTLKCSVSLKDRDVTAYELLYIYPFSGNELEIRGDSTAKANRARLVRGSTNAAKTSWVNTTRTCSLLHSCLNVGSIVWASSKA